MILAAQHIRDRCSVVVITTTGRQITRHRLPPMIDPFHERTVGMGFTFGLSSCGYDIRCAERVVIPPGGFKLASSIERFNIPLDLRMTIRDKSSWARRGLGVQNTVAEPGWRGYLTLELDNKLPVYPGWEERDTLIIEIGVPIAQVDFEMLSAPTEQPYQGRYQDQEAGPQPAIVAREGDR